MLCLMLPSPVSQHLPSHILPVHRNPTAQRKSCIYTTKNPLASATPQLPAATLPFNQQRLRPLETFVSAFHSPKAHTWSQVDPSCCSQHRSAQVLTNCHFSSSLCRYARQATGRPQSPPCFLRGTGRGTPFCRASSINPNRDGFRSATRPYTLSHPPNNMCPSREVDSSTTTRSSGFYLTNRTHLCPPSARSCTHPRRCTCLAGLLCQFRVKVRPRFILCTHSWRI